jgi:hypothetical protein
MTIVTDSPDLLAAKHLLDLLRLRGFSFTRLARGEDGPLRGTRETADWSDEIYIAGFSDSCSATRHRKSSLIIPGGLPVADSVTGDAITVLHAVSEWAI